MKYLMSIILLVALVSGVTAQDRNDKREKKRKAKHEKRNSRMEAEKVGYITEELDLSTEEAQKFWPIYNDFHGKLRKLKDENQEAGRGREEFTDAEGELFLKGILDREQQSLDLKKEYYKKMEGAISKGKIAKLHTIEHKFRDKVYRSIKRRMKRDHKEH